MQTATMTATLFESYDITPKVKHLVFKLEEDNDFNFIPGQFISFFFDWQGRTLRRSYSIANAPSRKGFIEIAVSFVENGPGSTMLFNLKAGDPVKLAGPYGRLILKPEPFKRLILVATSTGITPYRSMLEALAHRLTQDPNFNLLFILGVQTSQDVLYRADFETFTQTFPNTRFRIQLSRAEEAILAPNEYQGYVQNAYPLIELNPSEDMVYLCGNPSMIDASFAYLKEQGFNSTQIIREKYISN